GYGGSRALQDLQQRLLDALAAHIARDGRVFTLPRDLVDLVDVDDPGLGLLDVVVRRLDQLEQDVLDVLADIARLRQRRRVRDRERNVQHAGQGLGEEGLARAGGAEQEDVGLRQLDRVVTAAAAAVACHGVLPLRLGDAWIQRLLVLPIPTVPCRAPRSGPPWRGSL